MKLIVLNSINDAEWNEKICSFGGSIFHSTNWADYNISLTPSLCPQYFCLYSDENYLLGVALGFTEASKNKIVAKVMKRLNFDSYPLVKESDSQLYADFIDKIKRYAKDNGYVEIYFGSFASFDISDVYLELGFEITRRLEFCIDISKSTEIIWGNIGSKRRNTIRKAIKSGVVVENLPFETGIHELRRLQEATAKRILDRGGPDITPKSSKMSDPLESLMSAGVGFIMAAKINGVYESVCFYTFFNGIVYYMLAGHSKVAFESQAPTLLLWEGILTFRNMGAKIFNLGGCREDAAEHSSQEHGVYSFKKLLCSTPQHCASGKIIVNKLKHKIYNFALSRFKK
jgi:hypothetical protein